MVSNSRGGKAILPGNAILVFKAILSGLLNYDMESISLTWNF